MTAISSRTKPGIVTAFDRSTWWGEIAIENSPTKVVFNATCYIGTSTRSGPSLHETVTVTYSDETCDRILSVQHRYTGTLYIPEKP